MSQKDSVEKLLNEGKEIKNSGANFLRVVPIIYHPLGPNIIGFTEYHWDVLNSGLKKIQSDIITGYKTWYAQSLLFVQKYMPHESASFEDQYKKKSEKATPGVLDILELKTEIWSSNNAQHAYDFDQLFSSQISTISAVFNLLSEGPSESEKSGGSIESLKHVLIEAIYDFILKNPDIYHKNYSVIPPQRKKFVKERDGYKCQLCGEKFGENELEVDHIFPYALGGSNEAINLMPLCRNCNLDKGKSLKYYQSPEGKNKILMNIEDFVANLPIILNFGKWLQEFKSSRRSKTSN